MTAEAAAETTIGGTAGLDAAERRPHSAWLVHSENKHS